MTAEQFIESSKKHTPEKYSLIPEVAKEYLSAMLDDYADLKVKESRKFGNNFFFRLFYKRK